jgi:phage-related tail protein
MGFFETSAMDGSNVDEAFKLMVTCNSFFIVEILKRSKSAPKK